MGNAQSQESAGRFDDEWYESNLKQPNGNNNQNEDNEEDQ